ncbi:hypothetical protein T439DRAFT_134694 [Meredithblackwellia eburnea MCA 4105]
MRFHLLGAGSVGSFMAASLHNPPSTIVRLMVRRKDHLRMLLNSGEGYTPLTYDPQSARSAPSATIRIDREGIAKRSEGLEVELIPTEEDRARSDDKDSHLNRDFQTPIDSIRNDQIDVLFITTKANQTLESLRPIIPRLSSRSTIVLCQNGMGVLEHILDRFWPEDKTSGSAATTSFGVSSGETRGRPSFICATNTHGIYRTTDAHFVHAGRGSISFGVVPNEAVRSSVVSDYLSNASQNSILNPRSLSIPSLSHLPISPATQSLHYTIKTLQENAILRCEWLPLPAFQIVQLQKLCANTAINAITAILGVRNGASVNSPHARSIIQDVVEECSTVFAAHLSYEEGTWAPPPHSPPTSSVEDDRDYLPTRQQLTSSSRAALSSESSPAPFPEEHPLSPQSLFHYTTTIMFKTASNISSTLADLLRVTSKADLSKVTYLHSSPRGSPSPSSTPNFPPTATEVEYLHGFVQALGEQYGIATPLIRTLGNLVRLKEQMIREGELDHVVQRRLDHLQSGKARRLDIFGAKATSSKLSSLPQEPETTTDLPTKEHPHERAARYKNLRKKWQDRDSQIAKSKRDAGISGF